MAVNLTFINAALTRTGSDPITSYEDGTAGANIAAQNYEVVVTAALKSYPWTWATKVKTLNLLNPSVHGTPPPPWQYSYQLPNDMLLLRTIKVNGEPIDYDTMLKTAFCDTGSDAEVIAHYTWRPDEASWNSLFAEVITLKLEALFLRGIGERFQEGESRDAAAERLLRRAQLRDSQGKSPRDPRESALLRARRG